jgi:hypothetical protein
MVVPRSSVATTSAEKLMAAPHLAVVTDFGSVPEPTKCQHLDCMQQFAAWPAGPVVNGRRQLPHSRFCARDETLTADRVPVVNLMRDSGVDGDGKLESGIPDYSTTGSSGRISTATSRTPFVSLMLHSQKNFAIKFVDKEGAEPLSGSNPRDQVH